MSGYGSKVTEEFLTLAESNVKTAKTLLHGGQPLTVDGELTAIDHEFRQQLRTHGGDRAAALASTRVVMRPRPVVPLWDND